VLTDPEFPATNGQLVKQPIEWPVGAVRQLGLDIPGTTGWLGRWLDAAGGDPRLAVSFEPVLPPLLAGAKSAGATVPGGSVKLPASVTPGPAQTARHPVRRGGRLDRPSRNLIDDATFPA
jgi:hypothetical protein